MKISIIINFYDKDHECFPQIMKYLERLTFEKEVSPATKQAINNFLKNSKDKAEFNFTKQDKIVKENLARIEELQKYSYLYDKGLNPYDKFARYINESMGEVVISGDELKELAEEEI